MKFKIKKGESRIQHFTLVPESPVDGKAVPWTFTPVGNKPDAEVGVENLKIEFSKKSSKGQKQTERLVLIFQIPAAKAKDLYSWRFFGDGLLYCEGGEDYLDRISTEITDNAKSLVLTIKCLSDEVEKFNFSFLAMRRTVATGECHIFSSADPDGEVGRH